MKKTFLLKNLPLLLLSCGVLLTVAFAQTPAPKQKAVTTDTLPVQHKKIRDLDEALSEIDRGEVEMSRAFKEMDRDKMERDIRKAMKDIDMVKIKEDLARSMKEIDMQKIQADVQKAMKNIDCEKLKQDAMASLSKVDMEKMKADLEKVKQLDVEKMKVDLSNIQPEVEKAMKEARGSMAKARQEITNYKNLVNALDKDGLLNKNEGYKIEYKNRELTVNGKKLPAEAAKKYNQYLDGKDNFTLQKNEDGLNIRNDQ